MTIRRGSDWGRLGTPPEDLPSARSDREIGEHLGNGLNTIRLCGGDMFATLGGSTSESPTPSLELPIDVMQISFKHSRDSELKIRVASSHCVLRAINARGGWFRGSSVAVMNAQYLGKWDVAPRGHPNDGRVEVLEVDARMSVRQRMIARLRMKTGTHLPHPDISVKSVSEFTWSGSALTMWIDGAKIGVVQFVEIQVMKDFATLWI
ncbi:unannotated protein [freshwater metagenome]|uniref:Unannotated protein n=1 Tax=freshwater metagenome TaxID=449393 RepID=A0A6J7VUB8_9ZZZZ|nr:hypothetical protein [Actinomycetota bacterium]